MRFAVNWEQPNEDTFGADPPGSPGTLQGNQSPATFDPGFLWGDTTYHWRIDEICDLGKTIGDAWTFTTGGVRPDFDADDDVDQEDFGRFQICFSGIGTFHEPGCEYADLDRDNDVDQEDFGTFQGCLLVPGLPIVPGCEEADLNADELIDQADFTILQSCMGGANNPADPSCAD